MHLPCPASVGGCDGCTGALNDGELFLLLPPATFQRYKRFAALADNRNLRECPTCGLLQVHNSRISPLCLSFVLLGCTSEVRCPVYTACRAGTGHCGVSRHRVWSGARLSRCWRGGTQCTVRQRRYSP